MVTNLLKKYPELLDLMHLDETNRKIILRKIFDRDIENNELFFFRSKLIRPIKEIDGNISMDTTFEHLITESQEFEENGRKFTKRIFEVHRSRRLHWIKDHISESINDEIIVFSIIERNEKTRKNIEKTYIFNKKEKYVIVLELQRSKKDYYLLTAYHLNRDYGEKQIMKKYKKRLQRVL